MTKGLRKVTWRNWRVGYWLIPPNCVRKRTSTVFRMKDQQLFPGVIERNWQTSNLTVQVASYIYSTVLSLINLNKQTNQPTNNRVLTLASPPWWCWRADEEREKKKRPKEDEKITCWSSLPSPPPPNPTNQPVVTKNSCVLWCPATLWRRQIFPSRRVVGWLASPVSSVSIPAPPSFLLIHLLPTSIVYQLWGGLQ